MNEKQNAKNEGSSADHIDYRAQFGEDKILAAFFQGRTAGYFAEIGAFDGVCNSNTYYFEAVGWTGVLVEADPEVAECCRRARPGSLVVNCAVVAPGSPPAIDFQVVEGNKERSAVSVPDRLLRKVPGVKTKRVITVQARTLDAVLEDCSAPQLDFITIDVEGQEWPALQGFDLDRWKPALVILERNALPDGRIFTRMHRSGYQYIRTTGVNDWFQRASASAARHPAYLLRLLVAFWLPVTITHLGEHARRTLGIHALSRSIAKRMRR